MGVGKSTTGVALAQLTGLPYVDSDTDVETLVGCSGTELVSTHGVSLLHELETAVLLGALARATPSVISAASSIVENQLVRLALPRRADMVRLVLAPDEVIARQATGTHRRPMDIEELVELAERREPHFAALANLTLDAAQPTADLVQAIMSHLGSPPRTQ